MIVVDTSAIITILLREAAVDACISALQHDDEIALSAATLTEIFIVAGRRAVAPDAEALLASLDAEIVVVTPDSARRAADAYGRWGKGVHPAGLNFGDCFAYELAKTRACPLLFVGQDFAQTDIVSAI